MVDELQSDIDLDEGRVLAALSYVAVLVVIPLLLGRDDPYIRFHAKQGLVLLIFLLGGFALSWVVSWVGSLLVIICMIVAVVAFLLALLGRTWKIPVIYQLTQLLSF